MRSFQPGLFPMRPAPPPAPPPKAPPPPYVPDVEGARQRETRIVATLRQRPALLEDLLRRAHRPGLPPLTQSATLADLRFLIDEGKVAQHVLYALPGPLGGRWLTVNQLDSLDALLRDAAAEAPPMLAQRLATARACLREGR